MYIIIVFNLLDIIYFGNETTKITFYESKSYLN